MHFNVILMILDKREITRKTPHFCNVFMHFGIKNVFLHLYKLLKEFHHALCPCKREISIFLPKKRGDKSVIFSLNSHKFRWQAV